MDALEKERIISLRRDGRSYSQIAQATGLPLGSVKSFCSRNELKRELAIPSSPIENPGACRQCGAPVTQLPHRKAKLFCSDTCRMKWWNGQRSQRKNKKYRRKPHDYRTI